MGSSDEPVAPLTPTWQNVVRLALPTLLVMLLRSGLNVLEMVYVSRLGVQAVAAVALVLPICKPSVRRMAFLVRACCFILCRKG